jgi:hypothetical protein
MKTHYEIVIFEGTESDPEEYSQIACGMQVVNKMTKYSDQVTCKKCLKVIQKRVIASLVTLGNDGIGGAKMTSNKAENSKLILELLERSKLK